MEGRWQGEMAGGDGHGDGRGGVAGGNGRVAGEGWRGVVRGWQGGGRETGRGGAGELASSMALFFLRPWNINASTCVRRRRLPAQWPGPAHRSIPRGLVVEANRAMRLRL
jgi:hypothetical protein